ncbi:MAG: hypothetical protein K6E20_00100 [Acholeplasmatales bacterium]|nr:hypothetical protein [Acholeplasmatales bacterium]
MSGNDFDEVIKNEVKESFRKIAKSFCNCNHKYLYKYQSFNSNYIDNVINTIDKNYIFLSKLAFFEKDDIHEYQLVKQYFIDSLKALIDQYNESIIRDVTKIICLSYEYPNDYLIRNYSKKFGFVVKYDANKLKNYIAHRFNRKIIFGDVTYVDNKSEFIARQYNDTFSKYSNKLALGIQAGDDYIFSKISHDVINDMSYFLNSTNFLIKDNRFRCEKEFRFVFTNFDENEEYIFLGKNEVIKEIIILDSSISLLDKNKMYKLIDVCKKHNIKYRIEIL